jgi:hypothetical protein
MFLASSRPSQIDPFDTIQQLVAMSIDGVAAVEP